MTVEEARKIVGEKSNVYTDEQMEEIINTLTALADIAIDQALSRRTGK